MAPKRKSPNPIDIQVGSRVRLRRTMEKMSQEKLGEALGVTFQQIQKYEKGTNRIGASRLQKIAETLKVPVSFFFEDAAAREENSQAKGMAETDSSSYVVDFLHTAEGIELNRAFIRITSPDIRRRILEMVRTLANETGRPEKTT